MKTCCCVQTNVQTGLKTYFCLCAIVCFWSELYKCGRANALFYAEFRNCEGRMNKNPSATLVPLKSGHLSKPKLCIYHYTVYIEVAFK